MVEYGAFWEHNESMVKEEDMWTANEDHYCCLLDILDLGPTKDYRQL